MQPRLPSAPIAASPTAAAPRSGSGDTAVKALAVLHIALGLAGLVAGAVTIASFWAIPGRFSNMVLAFVVPIFLFLAIFLFIPSLLGGIGLLRGRAWGRIVILMLSGLMILIFPIGTALGGFGLWALLRRHAHSALPRHFEAASDAPRMPLNYTAATLPLLVALGTGVVVLLGVLFRFQEQKAPVFIEDAFPSAAIAFPIALLLAAAAVLYAHRRRS